MSHINLAQEFGRQWDIRSVPTAVGSHEACNQVVVCNNGFLYSVDSNTLGAATYRGESFVRKLRAIDGVAVVQDGDGGTHVIFPRAVLKYVERAMKPRQVRKLEPSTSAAVKDKRPEGDVA
jgi:hypothetical protein